MGWVKQQYEINITINVATMLSSESIAAIVSTSITLTNPTATHNKNQWI